MDKIDQIVKQLETYNEAYRRGEPLVSDAEYDRLVEKLRALRPEHPYLQSIEPEQFESKREVRHPVAMLSTEKAYSREELHRFLNRVNKAAEEIGIADVNFKVTVKLDGLAARDDGVVFASRGNGAVGYEISSALEKGVAALGGRGLGLGEIVMQQSYFEAHLRGEFEHPRNMVVGIVASDKLNTFAQKALDDGAVIFVPYAKLPSWTGKSDDLLAGIDKIKKDLLDEIDYPTDGVVIEVVDETLKDYMGATTHHYRWQIAFKSKGETAETLVKNIKWQVGRAGSITPVLEIEPVSLSGATIRHVSAHHAGLIKKNRIGIGSRIEVIRSGEVIPKLEKVIKKSELLALPEKCPSCGSPLKWDNDFLKCKNSLCKAQIEQRISHWFKTLGNADWFGIRTIQRLVDNGYDSLEKIYEMKEQDFLGIGFGPVQSKNLMEAINISKTKTVEDWRFLAAFGISNLGLGDSRKFLSHIELDALLTVKAADIEKIHGFGEVTGKAIESGIKNLAATIQYMRSLNFNLAKTPLQSEPEGPASPLRGKGIVFSGKMLRGSRDEMQAHARRLGARVQNAVTGTTDYLVCGEKVGAMKIAKARKLNVKIIEEKEYFELIAAK